MLQAGLTPYFLPHSEPALNQGPPLSNSHAENDPPLNHTGYVPSSPLGNNPSFHQAHQGQPAQLQVNTPMDQSCQTPLSPAQVAMTLGQVDPAQHPQRGTTTSTIPYVVPTEPYKIESFLLPGSIPKERLDKFFSDSTGNAYNPLWWNAIGVNPLIFTTMKSVQKWTDFFNKVFAIGDRFVVNVFKNGARQSKEAFVSDGYRG